MARRQLLFIDSLIKSPKKYPKTFISGESPVSAEASLPQVLDYRKQIELNGAFRRSDREFILSIPYRINRDVDTPKVPGIEGLGSNIFVRMLLSPVRTELSLKLCMPRDLYVPIGIIRTDPSDQAAPRFLVPLNREVDATATRRLYLPPYRETFRVLSGGRWKGLIAVMSRDEKRLSPKAMEAVQWPPNAEQLVRDVLEFNVTSIAKDVADIATSMPGNRGTRGISRGNRGTRGTRNPRSQTTRTRNREPVRAVDSIRGPYSDDAMTHGGTWSARGNGRRWTSPPVNEETPILDKEAPIDEVTGQFEVRWDKTAPVHYGAVPMFNLRVILENAKMDPAPAIEALEAAGFADSVKLDSGHDLGLEFALALWKIHITE